jgi:hypothetical protein
LSNGSEAPDPETDPEFAGFTHWRFPDLSVFHAHGEATVAAFLSTFRSFLSDPTPNVLWDLRECPLSNLAHDKLHWGVSQAMRSDTRKRPRGRSAFVCRGESDYNVMRILIAYAEAHRYGIDLAAFRDIDEARRWLDGEYPPTDRSRRATATR